MSNKYEQETSNSIIYSLLPVTFAIYEALLHNDISKEKMITLNNKNNVENKNFVILFLEIGDDIDVFNDYYFETLKIKIMKDIEDYKKKDIKIKEIGFITNNEKEKIICEKFGFFYSHNIKQNWLNENFNEEIFEKEFSVLRFTI